MHLSSRVSGVVARRRARLLAGMLLAAGVSVLARRLRALTPSGVVASTVVGGLVVGGIGIRGAAGLVSFFATSSALGRLPAGSFTPQARGAMRDAVQVVANGGVAAMCAMAGSVGPSPWRARMHAAFAGAVAAAAADTWASEIGARFGTTPRSIATFAPVPRGTSGGVTAAGLAGSVGGASLVALTTGVGSASRRATMIAGIAGSLADSVLGATIQEQRRCAHCHGLTEATSCCGAPTSVVRGISGINNDVVNAMATATGAAAGAFLHGV